MIDAFGGPNSVKGNSGPFYVGSGLAILSALVTFFFIQPLSHDGMQVEDQAVSLTVSKPQIPTNILALSSSVNTWKHTASIQMRWASKKIRFTQ